MKCPFCGNSNTSVVDSRNYSDGSAVKRRRSCNECGKRFTTFENIETKPFYIVKKDGSKELFDKNKIFQGITRATVKRDISTEVIDTFISELERELHTFPQGEIPSKELGELIMSKLKELDEVAYVRFVSVYKNFKDIKEFIDIVEDLNKKGGE